MKIVKIILSSSFLCIILTLAILWALLAEFPPLHFLEYKIYDFWATLRHQDIDNPIVIVAIDDKSIDTIGDWPWPRSYIAQAIENLSKSGAKTLGIHHLYSNNEFNTGLQEVKILRNAIQEELALQNQKNRHKIDKIIAESEHNLNHDARLISAVKSSVNVILPLQFGFKTDEKEEISKISDWIKMNSSDFKSYKPNVMIDSEKFKIIKDIFHKDEPWIARSVKVPFHELSTKASGLGHINYNVEKDGIVRIVPLFIKYQGRFFPSFSLQVALKYLKGNIRAFRPQYKVFGFTGLIAHSLKIPTDPYFQMHIDFHTDNTAYKIVSFSDVLNRDISGDTFQGKIVLIGVTAHNIASIYKSFNDSEIPAVLISANIIENLVNQRYLSRLSWAELLEVLVILYIGFFLVFVIPKVNARIGALILGTFLISWIALAFILFIVNGYWFKVLAPVFLSIFGYTLVTYKTFSKRREKENMELRKMVGLSFQGQGMLDMAYEKFLKCPVEDLSVKELLYNLGLDFERKRMFNKALAVYKHIFEAGKFKDIKDRIKKLKNIEQKVVLYADPEKEDKTLLLEDAMTKPTLGRYEILKKLGQGSMGTVYLGKDPTINRDVAIKTLNYENIDEDHLPEIKKQFFREAEAAGRLSHPNIVTIYDVGEEHDMAYIAMELIDGKDISVYCRNGKPMQLKQVLYMICHVAEALAYAHRNGVVHRDIKPANIILLKNNEVKVADFGIAQFISSTKTQRGIIYGTPNYMSPEQASGKRVDGRSDLFSLGIVFYELLTGEKPFYGENITDLLHAIVKAKYKPLSKVKRGIPPGCTRIVERLLTKSVTERIQSGDQLVEQISRYLKKMG